MRSTVFALALAVAGSAGAAPLPRDRVPDKRDEGYLGVYLGVAPGGGEAVVMEVVPNSPAAAAGVQAGDIITAVGPTQVRNPTEAIAAIRTRWAGDEVGFTVDRGGTVVALRAKLVARPKGPPVPTPVPVLPPLP